MTPRTNKPSDEELKVRSLLMRLYHSRQLGEAFYHANLVNGEAPKLEADGLIEQYGDGWRLTDAGLRQWAEMNTASFNSKYHYAGPFYKAMRDQLTQGEDEMKICKKEGCTKPRMVNPKGVVQTYCEEHQREYWAASKRATYGKQPNPKVAEAAGILQPEEHIIESPGNLTEENNVFCVRPGQPLQDDFVRLVGAPIPSERIETIINDPSERNACEECGSKLVIEALRAKSPKLAKLIDAMRAEIEAAAELGL